ALAAGFPELRLAAHYHSRHEDLFAFANRRYYGDAIEVLPAAHGSPDLGLAWRRVDGAVDDTGVNRAEVDAIVAEVTTRLRDRAHAHGARLDGASPDRTRRVSDRARDR